MKMIESLPIADTSSDDFGDLGDASFSSSLSSSSSSSSSTNVRDPLKCARCIESLSACVASLEKLECPECCTKMGKKEPPVNLALLDLIASISNVSDASLYREMDVGDKRKRSQDEYDADELLAMLQEKKRKENAPKLVELAAQQGTVNDEVNELKRALAAAEKDVVAAQEEASCIVSAAQTESSRIRTELHAKEGQFADINKQMRSIEDGSSSSTSGQTTVASSIDSSTISSGNASAQIALISKVSLSSSSSAASFSDGPVPGRQLYEAARDGHVAVLRRLVQFHRDAGTLDATLAWYHGKGTFALQAACTNGSVAAVKLLVEAGGEQYVNRVNRANGKTTLMTAVSHSKTECVRVLLAAPSINLHVKDKTGKMALDMSLTKIVRNLLLAALATEPKLDEGDLTL